MKDFCLEEDLNIIANSNIPISELENSSVFVTGATGLIGSILIKALLAIDKNINIIALVRNKKKAEKIFGEKYNRITFIFNDITNSINYDGKIDYIIHCASVTESCIMINKPVETIVTAVYGTKNVLDLAREKQVKSVVYVSSMEMYGRFDDSENDVREEKIGYVNPLSVRSNYPESKRLCENMCVAYMKEYGVHVKIARLAQTFGAGVLENENRVFIQFARSVIKEEDIILHTKGLSEGNYCYTRDVIKALLILLIKGNDGEAYNITNPESHMSIIQMAEMVCDKIANGKIKVVFDIPETNKFGYAQDTKIKLNADKMIALGWKPEVGLEEAYKRLINSLINTQNY